MKVQRFFLEIIVVGTAVACVIALLIASLGTVGGAAAQVLGKQASSQAAETISYDGMVTCSRCGARHRAELGRTAADCARICVRTGARLALVDGDKTYLLDGDMSLFRTVVGQRAHVAGSVSGNTIRVSSVAPEDLRLKH
jgi:hypothetical protein